MPTFYASSYFDPWPIVKFGRIEPAAMGSTLARRSRPSWTGKPTSDPMTRITCSTGQANDLTVFRFGSGGGLGISLVDLSQVLYPSH
jgi:hypothetical protein